MRSSILAACGALAIAIGAPAIAIAHVAASTVVATPDDPFEKFNRVGFKIEATLDRYFVGPLAHVYKLLTPGPIGEGIHNLVTNLTEPLIAFNGVLQLRPHRAATATARFAVNSTIGLAGLIDVGARLKMPHRPNGFGDTLGRYGVGPGPYFFLPLAGPSTLRDLVGSAVDLVVDPVHLVNYAYRTEVSISTGLTRDVDLRARSEDDLQALFGDAADPYATLRSTYLQKRESDIHGDGVSPGNLPDIGESVPDTPMPAPPPAAPGTATNSPPSSG